MSNDLESTSISIEPASEKWFSPKTLIPILLLMVSAFTNFAQYGKGKSDIAAKDEEIQLNLARLQFEKSKYVDLKKQVDEVASTGSRRRTTVSAELRLLQVQLETSGKEITNSQHELVSESDMLRSDEASQSPTAVGAEIRVASLTDRLRY